VQKRASVTSAKGVSLVKSHLSRAVWIALVLAVAVPRHAAA
jgi:hypothetical protein